jgi:hypothetical protein
VKPNLEFLRKVASGEVYPYASYSTKRGRYDLFRGGEATAKRHAEAGFVSIKRPPRVMMRGSVVLTDAGRAALSA